MTDLRKAAEMALKALEFAASEIYNEHNDDVIADAIKALRKALAQDEQEPVIDRRLKVKIGRQYGYALNEHWFYLQPADEYAEQALTKHSGISAPPSKPWVSLTDEEIDYIWGVTPPDYENFFEFPRAIEAKLKEKNNG